MTAYLEVDKSFAKLYDVLIYTLTIKSEGQNIENLRVVSPFSEALCLEAIKIDEENLENTNLCMESFKIKDIQKGDTVKVTFLCPITSFPIENPITHIVDLYYHVGKEAYILTSNGVITYVVDANISQSLVLEVDRERVNRQEQVTYTCTMKNEGNRKAEQILIGPLAPLGTTLIQEEVVCLEESAHLTKEEYLYIEKLEVGETRTFFYPVKIDVCKKDIHHALPIRYRLYYPNRQSVIQRIQTNTVTIGVETAYFQGEKGNLIKQVSNKWATQGDRLTYAIEGWNLGTVEAFNIQLIDTLPENTKWVEESLVVNGQKQSGTNIHIPNCLPKEKWCVHYEVEVLGGLPLQDILQTQALFMYSYKVGDEVITEEYVIESEPTYVSLAYLDPPHAHLIEGLDQVMTLQQSVDAYLSIMNKGNKAAREVEIFLELPQVIQLKTKGWTHSFNTFYKKYNQPISPQEIYQEQLSLKVIDIPPTPEILIGVKILYIYEVGEGRIEKISVEEELPILIEGPDLSIEQEGIRKDFVPEKACIGEWVECVLTLTNRGNVEAYHIQIEEEQVEAFQYVEPAPKLYLEKLLPGQMAYVSYRAQVKQMPSDEKIAPLSRITYVYMTSDKKEHRKTIDRIGASLKVIDPCMSPFQGEEQVQQIEAIDFAKGDKIPIHLPVTNNGNVTARNIKLELPLLEAGIWHNHNPILMSELMPGQSFVLSYTLEVTQIPPSNSIHIAPMFSYDFKGDTLEEKRERRYPLTPIDLNIHYACIEEGEGFTKTVNQVVTALNTCVYYTLYLKNTGNEKALDLCLQEEAIGGCIYERGTLTLNDVPLDHDLFSTPLLLGNLGPGESYKICYGVIIDHLPEGDYFYTRSSITYTYNVGEALRTQQVVTKPVGVQVIDPVVEIIVEEEDAIYVDLEEDFEVNVKLLAKGNIPTYALQYTLEGTGLHFNPDCQNTPIVLPVLYPNETKSIPVSGKVKEFIQEGVCSLRGKLSYKFDLEGNEQTRILYTPTQNVYMYGAGPLVPEAFKLKMDRKVVHMNEHVRLTFKLLAQGNCCMEQTTLYVKGFEDLGFYVQNIYTDTEVLAPKLEEGIRLGTLYPGQQQIVIVEGVMTHIPPTPLGQYKGVVTYTYTSYGDKTSKQLTYETSEETFIFKESGLSEAGNIMLRGNKQTLRKDEGILYTLQLYNGGNVQTENIRVALNLDERLQVNTIHYPVTKSGCKGELTNLFIDKLDCQEIVEIQFEATLKVLMPKTPLTLLGSVIYEYRDGEDQLKVCETQIAPYTLSIESPDFSEHYFKLMPKQKEVAWGEVIGCEIYCENGGNKKAEHVKIHLGWPHTFSQVQSLMMGESSEEKVIEIGTLEPLEKRILKFQLRADKLTIGQKDEIKAWLTYKDQEETIEIEPVYSPLVCRSPVIHMTPYASVQRGLLEEEITYTLQLENRGNCKVEGATLFQLLPPEVAYVENSLKVEGIVLQNEVEGTIEALEIGGIQEEQTLIFSYKGKIKTLPKERSIKYAPCLSYTYLLNQETQRGEIKAKCLDTLVEVPDLSIQKQCNKQKVEVGEEVEIHMMLTNTGSVDLDQIIFYDLIPEGVLLVEGSFKKDDQRQSVRDLTQGVGLGELRRNSQCFISYKLRVQTYIEPRWMHQVYVEYLFHKAHLTTSKKMSPIVEDLLQVVSPYSMVLDYETQILLPYDAPDLYQILEVKVETHILEVARVVGQPKEVEIKGILDYVIRYVGKEEERTIQVKKVWSKKMDLTHPRLGEALHLEVEAQKVFYAIVHKRALKVQVTLKVSEV